MDLIINHSAHFITNLGSTVLDLIAQGSTVPDLTVLDLVERDSVVIAEASALAANS